jgi:hypothetical protein
MTRNVLSSKYSADYNYEDYEFMRMDAIVSERLTSSPYCRHFMGSVVYRWWANTCQWVRLVQHATPASRSSRQNWTTARMLIKEFFTAEAYSFSRDGYSYFLAAFIQGRGDCRRYTTVTVLASKESVIWNWTTLTGRDYAVVSIVDSVRSRRSYTAVYK